MDTIMRVKNLQKYFPVKKKNFFGVGKDYVKANKDLTIDIYEESSVKVAVENRPLDARLFSSNDKPEARPFTMERRSKISCLVT